MIIQIRVSLFQLLNLLLPFIFLIIFYSNIDEILFAFVTRRPYCPGRPKTTLSLAPTVLTARLFVVKQSFFGLPGQYGCRVTKANCVKQRKVTECVPGSETYVRTKNGRNMMKCKCAECGITKTKFVKGTKGKGLILGKHSPFNKIPILGAIL